MRLRRRDSWCVALACACACVVGACGAPPRSDAASDAAALEGGDVSGDDVSGDGADDVDDVEPVEDTGTDCPAFAGFYVVAGGCTATTAALPAYLCIAQNGCALDIASSVTRFRGVAIGPRADLTASDAPEQNCRITWASTGPTLHCTLGFGETCDATLRRERRSTETAACCDIERQNCAEGRCALVNPDNTAVQVSYPACIPDTGMAPLAQACMRLGISPGVDTCARGLFCSNNAQPSATTRACRPYCLRGSTCGAGQVCVATGNFAFGGACSPSCALFGNDCPMGTTCRQQGGFDALGRLIRIATCTPNGPAAAGATCTDSSGCATGLTCQASGSTSSCQPMCDATHPCPGTQLCSPFRLPEFPTFGTCLPR